MHNLIWPDFKKNALRQINGSNCKGQVLVFCEPMTISKQETDTIENRMVRIKAGLHKINDLMVTLKRTNGVNK